MAKQNMKLATKLTLMGEGVVLALCVVAGISLRANWAVTDGLELAQLRNGQLSTVQQMRANQLELLLAAMDSIIDRADGSIAQDRMDAIDA